MREHGSSGHLYDVVERFAGVISQAAVRVVEARQHRLDELLQVQAGILEIQTKQVRTPGCAEGLQKINDAKVNPVFSRKTPGTGVLGIFTAIVEVVAQWLESTNRTVMSSNPQTTELPLLAP